MKPDLSSLRAKASGVSLPRPKLKRAGDGGGSAGKGLSLSKPSLKRSGGAAAPGGGKRAPKGSVPQVKPPRFLADFYGDLREQGLLPVVVALLVAIPLVPVIMSDPTPAFVPPAEGEGLFSGGGLEDGSLTVVAHRSGLRGYEDRFAGRTARDPFRAIGAAPAGLAGAGPEGSASEAQSAPEPSSPPGVSDSQGSSSSGDVPDGDPVGSGSVGGSVSSEPAGTTGDDGSGSSDSSGSGSDDLEVRSEPVPLFVQVSARVRFGVAGSGLLRDFSGLPRVRPLPGSGSPVAIYLGASSKPERAVFSISSDVTGVSGSGICASGRPADCQFLILRPGQAVNLFDSRRGVPWRLALTGIELTAAGEDLLAEMGRSRRRAERDRNGSGDPSEPVAGSSASLSEAIALSLMK